MFQSISYEDLKSKEAILAIINSNEFKDIFTSNNIDNVIVFGSLANDEFNEDSDIDIAIIKEGKLDFNAELKIIS